VLLTHYGIFRSSKESNPQPSPVGRPYDVMADELPGYVGYMNADLSFFAVLGLYKGKGEGEGLVIDILIRFSCVHI
jgi:hypothetical protein